MEADPKLFLMLETICKFDTYIDDHNDGTEDLTHILVVQGMKETKEGWKRLSREKDVTTYHDDAWICPFYPHSGFCKNPLYLQDDKLHLTRSAIGLNYERDSRNPCIQVYSSSKRQVNVAMSLAEARELVRQMQGETKQAESTSKDTEETEKQKIEEPKKKEEESEQPNKKTKTQDTRETSKPTISLQVDSE